jgi:hypothetical protein
MVVAHADPDDAFDSHLLFFGVNPRRLPIRGFASGMAPLGQFHPHHFGNPATLARRL